MIKRVFFLFFLFLIISLVSAADYTPTTETTCSDGVCNKVLYSGIRFVEEDNEWKKIEDARSLKDSGIEVRYLEIDENYPVEVIDYNYTSIKVRLNPKGIKIFTEDIPLRIWKLNESKEGKEQKEYQRNRDIKEEEHISFNVLNQEVINTYHFNGGEEIILEFGFNSTIIEYYSTGDSNGYDFSRSTWLTQTFTIGNVGSNNNFTLEKIELKMLRFGYPELVNVSIKSVNITDGKPIGQDLSTGLINASEFTTDIAGDWYNITMSSVQLNSSLSYAIVVSDIYTGASDVPYWRYDKSDGSYDGGSMFYSSNNGSTWDLVFNPSDAMFIIYGIEEDTTPPYFTTIPSNISEEYPYNVGVLFQATDDGTFDSYTVNDSNFIINSTGYLNNSIGLGVGFYVVNITINDSENNINWTFYSINISKGTPDINLSSSAGWSITPPAYSTINGTCYTELTCILYLIDVNVTNPYTTLFTEGSYRFNFNTTGNDNYTSEDIEETLTASTGSGTTTGTGNLCRYREFGYYNLNIPFMKEVNCI